MNFGWQDNIFIGECWGKYYLWWHSILNAMLFLGLAKSYIKEKFCLDVNNWVFKSTKWLIYLWLNCLELRYWYDLLSLMLWKGKWHFAFSLYFSSDCAELHTLTYVLKTDIKYIEGKVSSNLKCIHVIRPESEHGHLYGCLYWCSF